MGIYSAEIKNQIKGMPLSRMGRDSLEIFERM